MTQNAKPWPDTTLALPVNNRVKFRGDPTSSDGVTENPDKTDVPGPMARIQMTPSRRHRLIVPRAHLKFGDVPTPFETVMVEPHGRTVPTEARSTL